MLFRSQKIQISIDNMNAETLGLKSIKGQEAGKTQTGEKPSSVTYKGMTYQWNADKTADSNKALAISSFKVAISNAANDAQYAPQLSGASIFFKDSAGSVYANASAAKAADVSIAQGAMSTAVGGSFTKYIDKTATTGNGPTVASSGAAFTMDKPGVDTYARANATITAVQNAINKVSSQRSALGAIQNRLEHTIANLDNVAENTQAAESRIRDLDMASEMVEYSKNNILAQAGQSMLAQANQSTQGVLSLLG